MNFMILCSHIWVAPSIALENEEIIQDLKKRQDEKVIKLLEQNSKTKGDKTMVKVTMDEECQFLKDLEDESVDASFLRTNRALYNLMLARSQVKLFSKGIKPNRFWRLKHIKQYFGIKGSTKRVLDQLDTLNQIIKEGQKWNLYS